MCVLEAGSELEPPKTIRFAEVLVTNIGDADAEIVRMNALGPSDNSIQALDIFDQSTQNLDEETQDSISMENSFHDDDDQDSIISDDEDNNTRNQALYAIGAAGFFALLGWTAKKVLQMFDEAVRNSKDEASGGHMNVDPSSTNHAAAQAAASNPPDPSMIAHGVGTAANDLSQASMSPSQGGGLATRGRKRCKARSGVPARPYALNKIPNWMASQGTFVTTVAVVVFVPSVPLPG